jgi:hypothetical protein
MHPTLGTLIGLPVRRLDDARRRLRGWRRGAQGSGVGRSRAGYDGIVSVPSGAVVVWQLSTWPA